MEKVVDVLVVGGCTSGLYFGGLLAQQGLKVIVAEKQRENDVGNEYNVIHIAKEAFSKFKLKEPKQGDVDYIDQFDRTIIRSALNNHPKTLRDTVLVLKRAGLVRRLTDFALEGGAVLLYDASFEKLIFDSQKRVGGCIFKTPEGKLKVTARIVADASGIPAVVRTSLPDDYGVENFITGPRDQFYVVLYYSLLSDPEKDKVEVTTAWTHYKTWLGPAHCGNQTIMGVGANLSYEYAEMVFERFAKRGYLPEHKLDHIERGSTAYRRPPYSLVGDNFVVLGAAACITNPWTGEGVPYGWLEGKIAAEEYGKILMEGKEPTQAAAWNVNVRYIMEQGALFAKNLALLSGATDCTEEENDYEYKNSIIYDENESGKATLIWRLIKGVLSRNISTTTLGKLISASSSSEKLFKHYMNFPKLVDNKFGTWVKEADALWANAGSMADRAELDWNKIIKEREKKKKEEEGKGNIEGEKEKEVCGK